MIEAIEGVNALASTAAMPRSDAVSPSHWGNWFAQQLHQLNAVALSADEQVQALALGEVDNLHQVMINLEKAKLTFSLAVQLRNKALEGYQDIMRMQV